MFERCGKRERRWWKLEGQEVEVDRRYESKNRLCQSTSDTINNGKGVDNRIYRHDYVRSLNELSKSPLCESLPIVKGEGE